MSDWFGETKTKVDVGPQARDLQQLRLDLVRSIMGGDWSPMQGFFDKVLIPRTKNELTAAGLGRSGAIGEAVSSAQLSYGTDFLKALLSGIPSGETRTQTREPGIFDWLSLALGVGGTVAGMKWK